MELWRGAEGIENTTAGIVSRQAETEYAAFAYFFEGM
jgi:hypothetical protein